MGQGRLRALIFDLDGVVAETEAQGHRLAFNQAFREAGLGIEWDEETYGRLLEVPGGKERIAHYLEACPTCPRLGPEAIARLHRRKTEIFKEMVAKGLIPYRPGVLRLWREAQAQGVRLALATTAHPESARALLGEWAPRFLLVAGEMAPRKKPAPDAYLLALEGLGLGPEEALAIEDSPQGLEAALGAGLPTLITPSHYTRKERFPGALAVVEHLGEPGNPARVLEGPERGPVVVTLDRLRRWLGKEG